MNANNLNGLFALLLFYHRISRHQPQPYKLPHRLGLSSDAIGKPEVVHLPQQIAGQRDKLSNGGIRVHDHGQSVAHRIGACKAPLQVVSL
ncbi:MAG: hypothetical protein ACRYGG_21210, partial [Janthinobacterium lividum]